MLSVLRDLFKSKPKPDDDGKVTLAGVLERGWFELFYQPKIDLRTMRLVGAEALVRARHPTRGVLGPGVFLPGASEADMLALTERVIVTALHDWEDCAANGMSVKLSVNVPPEVRIGFAASTVRTARSAAHTPPVCTAKTRQR